MHAICYVGKLAPGQMQAMRIILFVVFTWECCLQNMLKLLSGFDI